MTIQAKQIQQLQTICSKRFQSRQERLDFLSDFTGTTLESAKDLSRIQADDVIYFLNTGKEPNNQAWGRFNHENRQHKTILSLCHQLGWVQEDSPQYVDLSRLGGWLKSKRSPVQKPLLDLTAKETSKIIFALENMLKKQYKK